MTTPKLIVCVACGCDDLHACRTAGFFEDEPCGWIAVRGARGVCSTPACRSHLKRFKAGDNALTERARKRQDKIRGRHVPGGRRMVNARR